MKEPLPGGKRIDPPESDKVEEFLGLLAAAGFSDAEKEALINKLTGE